MLNYLKSRAGEVTSIWSAAGLSGIIAAYLLGQITPEQAIVGAAVAVVGYLLPEDKALAQAIGKAVAENTPALKSLVPAIVATGVSLLAACTPAQQQLADTVSTDECQVLAWGTPIAAALGSALNPTAAAIVADATEVLDAGCTNGDAGALARAPDVAKALVALIYPPAPQVAAK